MSLRRYTAVGIAATAVHYATLIAAIEFFSMPSAPAAALGAILGAFTAYAGNRRYTFASAKAHRQALPMFLLVAALSAILSASLVWLLSMHLGIHYLAAQAVASITMLVAGYALNKRWTFA